MNKILILVVIFLMMTPTFAQRKKTKTSKQKAKSVQSTPLRQGFITTEFNESIEQLPTNFAGHEIIKVHDNLKILPLKKSEFESTSEYNERIKRLSETRLFGSLNFGSTFVFSYTPDKTLASDSLKADYDADKQILSISIRSGYGSSGLTGLDSEFLRLSDLQSLTVFVSSARSLGSYIGVNGYGVRAKVLKGELDQYEIIFPNCVGTVKSKSSSYREREEKTILSTNNVVVNVDVPPIEAIDLKYNIGVLIIGNLISPYSNSERILFDKATIKSPTEIWLQKRYVFLDVKSMWIYSRGTGKVYKKITKCSLKPPTSSYDSLRDSYHYFF